MAYYNFDDKSLTFKITGSGESSLAISSASLNVSGTLISQNYNFNTDLNYLSFINAPFTLDFGNKPSQWDIKAIVINNNGSSNKGFGFGEGSRPYSFDGGKTFPKWYTDFGFINTNYNVYGSYPGTYAKLGVGVLNIRVAAGFNATPTTTMYFPINIDGFGRLLNSAYCGNDGGFNGLTVYNRVQFFGYIPSYPVNAAVISHQTNKNLKVQFNGNGIITGSLTTGTSSFVQTGIINVSGNLLPYTNQSFSLGANTYEWKNIWAQDDSINTSDKNLKYDIKECILGLKFINDIRPVTYNFINDSSKHYGFIAQEIFDVLNKNNIDTKDFAGYIKTDNNTFHLRYNEFIGPLIKAIQELSLRISVLEKEIEARGL